MRTKEETLIQICVKICEHRFQSASFANKGRNYQQWLLLQLQKCFNPLPLRTKEETSGAFEKYRAVLFQSASFANKGRNCKSKCGRFCTSCFNPLPLRTKEETNIWFFSNRSTFCFNPLPLRTKEETAAQKPPQKCIRKRLITFSRHNNCESVCAILNKR
ncbi:hypothetical protein LEP1GSC081_3351 [Leptospira kirschneri str. H1]|uniref:Uncharacterized protein n=1 Tax=Leptospira kirschneri str. H1 TaxID=1049966 RepID=A0A0E2B382_9LEPT|nr:hypothetical protein LEP1GSC081_3351 [Leptospira kirschneri str. H1]